MQVEGLQFPTAVRDQGTSVELIKTKGKDPSKWAEENRLAQDKQWGIIARAKARNEDLFLALVFRKVTRTRLAFKDGLVERKQEETTEPEIGEFHLRSDGLLELYSCSAKLRSSIVRSLSDSLGKDGVDQLYLSKESINKLMKEALEVLSVSLTGLGNPFFSDATLTGADPVNSKTCKELMSSGDIKAFRGKFSVESSRGDAESSSNVLMATVHNNCKLRFFPGTIVLAQSDIEDFVTKVYRLSASADSQE